MRCSWRAAARAWSSTIWFRRSYGAAKMALVGLMQTLAIEGERGRERAGKRQVERLTAPLPGVRA